MPRPLRASIAGQTPCLYGLNDSGITARYGIGSVKPLEIRGKQSNSILLFNKGNGSHAMPFR